jgi:hypothetical protein
VLVQGQEVVLGQGRAVQMVLMPVHLEEVEAGELATMVALHMVVDQAQAQAQAQALANICKGHLITMVGILVLVATEGVEEDKPEVIMALVATVLVVALVPAPVKPLTIGMDRVMPILMLMEMVVAKVQAKMVAVVLYLAMVMQSHRRSALK